MGFPITPSPMNPIVSISDMVRSIRAARRRLDPACFRGEIRPWPSWFEEPFRGGRAEVK